MKISNLHYWIYSFLLFYITTGNEKGEDGMGTLILKKQDCFSSFKISMRDRKGAASIE